MNKLVLTEIQYEAIKGTEIALQFSQLYDTKTCFVVKNKEAKTTLLELFKARENLIELASLSNDEFFADLLTELNKSNERVLSIINNLSTIKKLYNE